MAGFEFAFTLSGGAPIRFEFPVADTVVLSQGELVNIESGEADAGASGDATLAGIAEHDVDNTLDGELVSVIINPDAVYSVVDANARSAGDTLDIASGGMGVTTSGDADLVVVRNCTAAERTLVKISSGEHYLDQ